MPFFLIHQPVIIIALFVVQWEANIMAKLPLVVLGSFVVALGPVELIIKRFDVLRRLFGARPGIGVQQRRHAAALASVAGRQRRRQVKVSPERETKPWLQHYDDGVPASIDYPRVSLDALLAASAARNPEHPALIFGARAGSRVMDRAMTYGQLDEAVNQFAAGLQELDVKKGDRVALMLPNCPQFVIAFYGILRAGAIAVPCNFLYAADEIEHQLNDARAEIVVLPSPYYRMVHGIQDRMNTRHIVVANIKESFPPLLRLLFTLAKEKKGGHRINNHPQVKEFDLGSVRACLSGAAPLPREVQERFQALTGSKLVEAYGLSETSPAPSASPGPTPTPVSSTSTLGKRSFPRAEPTSSSSVDHK